jgi:hypothetical protein
LQLLQIAQGVTVAAVAERSKTRGDVTVSTLSESAQRWIVDSFIFIFFEGGLEFLNWDSEVVVSVIV